MPFLYRPEYLGSYCLLYCTFTVQSEIHGVRRSYVDVLSVSINWKYNDTTTDEKEEQQAMETSLWTD